jgi:S-methylmethionine-dependent homocysteine/selenocysteine methylase
MDTPVTILDGGMGRELLRIGAPFRQPEWSALALLDGPEWVVRAHANFIAAGTDVITTNSYAVVPFHLGKERFAARGEELAALSGRLARRAADAAPRPVRVLGSLPPLFGSYRPDLFDAADAPRIIDPLVAGLAPHVDVWLGETLSSVAEAVAVRESIDRAGERAASLPMWISYSLDDSRRARLRSGETVDDAVRTAVDLGASAVLFNCCLAESISVAVPVAVAIADGRVAIGGYANRFVEAHTESNEANDGLSDLRDDLSPNDYAELVAGWVADGATLVGGCCGMGPDHIAALVDRFGETR